MFLSGHKREIWFLTENGKATYWTEPECSAIKLQMKKNETGNQNKALLQSKGRVMLPSES